MWSSVMRQAVRCDDQPQGLLQFRLVDSATLSVLLQNFRHGASEFCHCKAAEAFDKHLAWCPKCGDRVSPRRRANSLDRSNGPERPLPTQMADEPAPEAEPAPEVDPAADAEAAKAAVTNPGCFERIVRDLGGEQLSFEDKKCIEQRFKSGCSRAAFVDWWRQQSRKRTAMDAELSLTVGEFLPFESFQAFRSSLTLNRQKKQDPVVEYAGSRYRVTVTAVEEVWRGFVLH